VIVAPPVGGASIAVHARPESKVAATGAGPKIIPAEEDFNTAGYDRFEENPFLAVANDPLSTFSIDVAPNRPGMRCASRK